MAKGLELVKVGGEVESGLEAWDESERLPENKWTGLTSQKEKAIGVLEIF